MTERVDCHGSSRKFCAADGAVDNAVIAACFGAGSFDSVFLNCRSFCVTESVGLFKCRVIAASAGVVFLVSVRCARCRNCIVVNKVMTERVDCHGSSRKFCAADGAVDNAVIATCFGAGCFNSVFLNCRGFCVTESIYNCVFKSDFLFAFGILEYLFASLACEVFNIAVGCTFCSNSFGLFHIVTESVNGFLCNKSFVAYGAVLALRQTGFGASGSDCFIDNLGVTESVDCFCFSRKLLVADGAVDNAVIAACFGAGSFDSVFLNSFCGSMTVCVNPFVLNFLAAIRTLKGCVALFGAGGSGNYTAFSKAVNKNLNGVC